MKVIYASILCLLIASCDLLIVTTEDGCIMQKQDNYLVGLCGETPTFQWTNPSGQDLRAQKINNKFRFFIKDETGWRLIGSKESVDLTGAPNE